MLALHEITCTHWSHQARALFRYTSFHPHHSLQSPWAKGRLPAARSLCSMGKSPEPLSGTARNACARAPERLETRTDGVECAYPLTAPVRSSFPLQRKRRQCCCTWMGGGRGGVGIGSSSSTGVRLGSPDQSSCLSVVKIIRYKALVEFASIDLPSVVLVAVVVVWIPEQEPNIHTPDLVHLCIRVQQSPVPQLNRGIRRTCPRCTLPSRRSLFSCRCTWNRVHDVVLVDRTHSSEYLHCLWLCSSAVDKSNYYRAACCVGRSSQPARVLSVAESPVLWWFAKFDTNSGSAKLN